MSAVDELLAYVRRCLDEDERVIREAADPLAYFYADGHSDAVNRWFDRWNPDDPEPMLAEVEAKRERLDWIEGELGDDPADVTAQWLAKLEAKPFAGREGWQEAWRA